MTNEGTEPVELGGKVGGEGGRRRLLTVKFTLTVSGAPFSSTC
jgi:hypothetical protein